MGQVTQSDVERLERLTAIPAADVDGADVADCCLGGEMAVAAEDVGDGGEAQEQLAEARAAQVRLGEVPLRCPRRRQQLAEGQVVNGGNDATGCLGDELRLELLQ